MPSPGAAGMLINADSDNVSALLLKAALHALACIQRASAWMMHMRPLSMTVLLL